MNEREQRVAKEFWKWVLAECRTRDWSIRELEIRGGVGNAVIGARMREDEEGNVRPPTFENIQAITQAFGIPLEEGLRLAGYEVGGLKTTDPVTKQIFQLSESLPEEERRKALDVLRAFFGKATASTPGVPMTS